MKSVKWLEHRCGSNPAADFVPGTGIFAGFREVDENFNRQAALDTLAAIFDVPKKPYWMGLTAAGLLAVVPKNLVAGARCFVIEIVGADVRLSTSPVPTVDEPPVVQ